METEQAQLTFVVSKLAEPMPTRFEYAKKLGGPLNKDTCRWPSTCGRRKHWRRGESSYKRNQIRFCHRHFCPISAANRVYESMDRIYLRWNGLAWWQEVADGLAYQRAWYQVTQLGLDATGVPTDHGTIHLFTPEPIEGSIPYTGDWWDLGALVYAMPEHSKIRHPYGFPTNHTAYERARAENEKKGEKETGLPLVPVYDDHALDDWSDEEQVYLLDEAGFELDVDCEGNLEISGDLDRIEEVLHELEHPAPEFMQVTFAKVLHELRMPERPAKYNVLKRLRREPVVDRKTSGRPPN